MKSFQDYIKEGKVKKKTADPAESRSLFRQAKERFADLQGLPLTEKSASFRFEDGYEVLREALQAFLALEGYKPYSHEAVLSFAVEHHLLSEAEYHTADRYRGIRNDINYRGKVVIIEEARELIGFVEALIQKLEREFDKKFS